MEGKDRVTDLVGDLLGERWRNSPNVRQAESETISQFSPHSPHSLTENDPGRNAPLDLTREVAECVPIACEEGPSGKDVMATPVPLDLTLAAATAGLPITAEQFRSFLSQDDLADIAAGLIPVECLRAYAERFSKQFAPAAVGNDRVRCGDCQHFERIDHPEDPTGIPPRETLAHYPHRNAYKISQTIGSALQ